MPDDVVRGLPRRARATLRSSRRSTSRAARPSCTRASARWSSGRSGARAPDVMVRHNLTVQFEPGQADLPEFFAANRCEVVCSLPHYTQDATDRQRGRGVYEKSASRRSRRLNAAGYGRGDGLVLNLVSNPVGAFLPPAPGGPRARHARVPARRSHGIVFDRLFTHHQHADRALRRLAAPQRASTTSLPGAGSRPPSTRRRSPGSCAARLISVGCDGRLYDCDFNQMLELRARRRAPATIFEPRPGRSRRTAAIRTGDHCFGCTAGAGSSCGGALV